MLIGNEPKPVTWQLANEPQAVRRLVRKLEREAPGPVQLFYEAGRPPARGTPHPRPTDAGSITRTATAWACSRPEQDLLLPPSLRDWLPEDHLAFFVSDLIDQLDLSGITAVYEDEERGYPPYREGGTTLRAMAKTYRSYVPEQDLLLPPSLRDWLPEDHLAFFVSDLIDQLDLSGITAVYESTTCRTRRNLQNLDPRFKSGRASKSYLCEIPRHSRVPGRRVGATRPAKERIIVRCCKCKTLREIAPALRLPSMGGTSSSLRWYAGREGRRGFGGVKTFTVPRNSRPCLARAECM
ncbi:MAG: hypothetical protein LC753_08945 [Acidobacteria bacterium]|nr:hypothetical protein [Acidobacteriota bacterium]